MTNDTALGYLFHSTPPVELGPEPLLFLMQPHAVPMQIPLESLAGRPEPLVTHSFGLLVEWFRARHLPLPEMVIDLEVAKKLALGMRRHSAVGREAPWGLWKLLEPALKEQPGAEELRTWLGRHLKHPRGENSEVKRWAGTIARTLSSVWRELATNLEARGEMKRLLEVEVPVYNIMLQIQLSGAQIDRDACERLLAALEDRYESSHYDLGIGQGINVNRALQDPEYLAAVAGIPLTESGRRPSAAALIEEWRFVSKQCDQLRQLRMLERNRVILLRMISFEGTECFISYDTMGTVTGRILAVDPHLQHLKREYRSILAPHEGRAFLYLDYAQFEPSIMACLSGDSTLLSLCSEGDLYGGIAQRIPESRLGRNEFKKLYLAYSYGMEQPGLVKLVGMLRPEAASAAAKVVGMFEEMFGGVEGWKNEIWDDLARSGRVGTVAGNYRYRANSGGLEPSERRWAISQVVQGTGALILKRVCIAIDREMPEASIILPMHDALLLEVPTQEKEGVTRLLAELFRRVYSETCPGIEARVASRAFAPEHET